MGGALATAVVLAWLLLPTAPNYDTATHLLWGSDLLHGRAPDVDAAAAPTLHPLWLLAAVVAQAVGGGASLLQLVTIASMAVVIVAAFRLAASIGGVIAGAVAAVASGSSFALLLLAFKGYVDVPFLALVLAALVHERRDAREPEDDEVASAAARRDTPLRRLAVPLLMLAAGLLRPEAWALGLLLVLLRLLRGLPARSLVVPAAVVLAAPVVWCLCDLALTGDALHSLTGTQALAEELGRKTGLGQAPTQLAIQLADLARPPVAFAGLIGVGLAIWTVGLRAVLVPVATLVASGLGFLLVGALGLPLLQRYLQLPAVLLCAFAGVAAAMLVQVARTGRWPTPAANEVAVDDLEWRERSGDSAPGEHSGDLLSSGRLGDGSVAVPSTSSVGSPALRWSAVAMLALGVLGASGYVALKASSFRVLAQGVLREADWQRDGADLLRNPAVVRAAACGPITLPTYRFVPEVTLRAGLAPGSVLSRATALGGAGPQPGGVAIVIEGSRAAKTRLGWAASVPRTTNETPAGFAEIARRGPFVATARC